jgi:hypothetical protein
MRKPPITFNDNVNYNLAKINQKSSFKHCNSFWVYPSVCWIARLAYVSFPVISSVPKTLNGERLIISLYFVRRSCQSLICLRFFSEKAQYALK